MLAVTLSQIAAPTDPSRSDAPITAIARGSRIRATARESAALLAPLDAVEELVGGGQFPVEVDHAGLEPSLQRPAGLGEHRQHRPVVGQHLGGEPLDAVGPGDRREVLEHQGGDPLALVVVGDHERGFGFVASRPSLVARPGDELAARLDDERDPVDHVDVREVVEIAALSSGFGEKYRR